PAAVGGEVEAGRTVAGVQIEHPGQLGLRGDIGHLDQGFDPAIQVAVHQVGRTDPVLLVAFVAEPQNPRMLQEPADDRAHPDVLRQPRYPRAQGADPAHDQIDPYPDLAGPVQSVHNVLVHNGVDLDLDPSVLSISDIVHLAFDPFDDAGADAVRGDQQSPVRGL